MFDFKAGVDETHKSHPLTNCLFQTGRVIAIYLGYPPKSALTAMLTAKRALPAMLTHGRKGHFGAGYPRYELL